MVSNSNAVVLHTSEAVTCRKFIAVKILLQRTSMQLPGGLLHREVRFQSAFSVSYLDYTQSVEHVSAFPLCSAL